MPVNAASKSTNVADEIAEKDDVQFVVHSHFGASNIEQLNQQVMG